ncbi:hypothetical protein ACFSLT_04815 [Novosphingobium resinovorum]
MPNDNETAAAIVGVMTSLSSVMREETRALESGIRALDLAELASAKARLVGTLEEHLARVTRQEPGWTAQLDAPCARASPKRWASCAPPRWSTPRCWNGTSSCPPT